MSKAPPTPPDPKLAQERLKTFFARSSVVANLLHSRLALPLLYPLNPGSITDPFSVQNGVLKGDADKLKNNPIASTKWDRRVLTKSLAHITPVIIGMSRFVHVLKAGNALAHYRGGLSRPIFVPKRPPVGKHKLHFLRPQVWRVLQPGNEWNTRFRNWRSKN
eukprot:GDKI01030317.1.p1 GENE.GDKI01030317.1~~GDKI01030317.1.p1  ORF type:complete len:162 (-),score=15.21 GDKI01030317.1:40-525(-)